MHEPAKLKINAQGKSQRKQLQEKLAASTNQADKSHHLQESEGSQAGNKPKSRSRSRG